MKTRETRGERRAATAAGNGRSSAQRDSKPHTEAGDLLPARHTRPQLTRGAERPLPSVTRGPSKSLPQFLHPQQVSAFCFILLPEPSAMSHCTARRIIPKPPGTRSLRQTPGTGTNTRVLGSQPAPMAAALPTWMGSQTGSTHAYLEAWCFR